MSNLQEVPTDELLSFHDFNIPTTHQKNAEINVAIDDNFPSASIDSNSDPLERNVTDSKVSSIWSLGYYQKYFDVDTNDVVDRIIASITPISSKYSLRRRIVEKPDLYGPFWISTTLIFTIAIGGNIVDYLRHSKLEEHWKYDFKLVSYAATAVWTYVLLVPLALWATISWNDDALEETDVNLKRAGPLELVCIYGYSLFIFIPVSILWSVQVHNLQWFLAIISGLLSGSVLLVNLLPSLRAYKYKLFIVIVVLSCHLFLVLGFVFYFFYSKGNDDVIIPEGNVEDVTTVH